MDYKTLSTAAITAAITAIISVIWTYFNKKDHEIENKEGEYFKILFEYLEIRGVIPNINPVDYINKYKFKETFIPGYIFYAAKHNTTEELEKLLITDYFSNYPNLNNNISKTFGKITKIVIFLEYILCSCIPMVTIIFFCITIYDKIISKGISNFNMISLAISIIIFIIIFLGIITLLLLFILRITKKILKREDMYTLHIKTMQRRINKKIKLYNKENNKYYL